MTNIKPYVEMTGVFIGNNIVYTQQSVEDIASYLETHHFIIIDGVGYNRFKIDEFRKVKVDELEAFIYSQPDKLKVKLLDKKAWLKETMGKEMTIEYAKNFISEQSK